MKGLGQIAFFAFVGIFAIGLPAGFDRLTKGQWPKDLWIEILVFFATCAVLSIHEQLQTIFSATLEIKEQGIELRDKIEELENTLSDIESRLPSRKSYLEPY